MYFSRIGSLHESGIFLKWKKHHFPVDKCSSERKLEQLKSHPITFRQVTASFLILVVGMTLGTVSFVIECLSIKVRRKLYDTPSVNLVTHCGRKGNFMLEKEFQNVAEISDTSLRDNKDKDPEMIAKQPNTFKVDKQTFFTWKRR